MRRHKTRLRAGVVWLLAACLAGCVAPGGVAPTFTKATPIPAQSATSAITIGKSTKADVMGALGRTTAIAFDSGYEVWVYFLADDAERSASKGKTEFVVLFSPGGVVTKTRVRPPPAS
jgi:hypothetical protein